MSFENNFPSIKALEVYGKNENGEVIFTIRKELVEEYLIDKVKIKKLMGELLKEIINPYGNPEGLYYAIMTELGLND